MAEVSEGATTAVIPRTTPLGSAVTPAAAAALDAAKAYARDALAPETRRAYAADWAHFTRWCANAGCDALPAEPAAVAAYLAALAPLYSRAALERRLAAIGQQHRLRGLAWPAGHPHAPAPARRA